MKDFERRGIEVDAPIHGHPETPHLPKRRTPEDIAPSLGSRESELDKARQEGDVIAQDMLSKNPFSNPERERVETPKKRHIKPKPKKAPITKVEPAPKPKKKVTKPSTPKKETPKKKEETKKEESKKKKKPIKESHQRFIRIIPF
jgi:outer membrane biosynthesis protein TonB